MVTRKKLDDEIVLRREMLKNNYSRASAYYKSAFKDCYKEVVIRGEEISRYMYKRYALDKNEYVFHKSANRKTTGIIYNKFQWFILCHHL